MKKLLFLIFFLLVTNCYSVQKVRPTIRGWIIFSNRVTRNFVLSVINDNKSFGATIVECDSKDFEVGGSTLTASYTIKFRINFEEMNRNKFNSLISLAESVEVNDDVVCCYIEIFEDIVKHGIPDTISRRIIK